MAGICFAGDGEPSPPPNSRLRKMEYRQLNAVSDVAGSSSSSSSPQKGRRRRRVHMVPGECEKGEENRAVNNNNNNNNNYNNNNNNNKNNPGVKYGVTSVCGRRRDMEDAVSIHPSFAATHQIPSLNPLHFFGLFDGHGCSHVSMRCENRMHEIVKEEIENELGESEEYWKNLMQRSFGRMDEEVKEYYQKQQQEEEKESNNNITCRCQLQTPHQYDTVGSTALVVLITPQKFIISNCGDSRAVLSRKSLTLPLSSDHKPDRPDELFRIESTGGRVIYWDGARVLGVLSTSRSIGDAYLKPYVISEPEVVVMDRTAEDEFIVMASDGLWDVVSNETACEAIRMCMKAHPSRSMAAGSGSGSGSDKTCSYASFVLTKLAMARHSSDNISVVVIDLRGDHHHQ